MVLNVAGGGAAPGFALLNAPFSLAHSEEMRFLFVLSSVAKNEKILTAELHLFRLWPRVTDGPKRHHFCQVRMGMGMGMGWDGLSPSLCPRMPLVHRGHLPAVGTRPGSRIT